MALVDYGSDSDSDTPPSLPTAPLPLPIKAPAAVPIASTSSLALPPPKSTTSKRTKGPLRIMLDLPPPSTSTSTSNTTNEEVEPARKKPKFTISSGGGGGGGLAAMLPAPKNDVTLLLDKALGKSVKQGSGIVEASGVEERVAGEDKESGEGRTFSTGFVPYSLSKGKKAAAAIAPIAPVIDFFGLGSTTTTSLPSSSSSSHASSSTSLPRKSSITISSAPSLPVAHPTTTSSYGDTPTPTDPYPGFILLPSGQWVAKDQSTYDAWVSSLETKTTREEEEGRPKGFGESDVLRNGGGFVEVDDRARNEERERMVGQAKVRPGREEMEKPVLKTAAKLGGGRAKSRHQLSTLLADAIENRADLEERIAQAKSARKGSGAKYGF